MIRAVDNNKQTWMKQGACVNNPDVDPEWFFPTTESVFDLETITALKVCRSCSVTKECLDYALQNFPIAGTWGGLKNSEIVAIAKQQKNKRRGINECSNSN